MMSAYGQGIKEVLRWTFPQLRLIGRYQTERQKEERRWQLLMAAGQMSEEAFDEYWEALDGPPVEHTSPSGGSNPPASSGQSGQSGPSFRVDKAGNVIAPAGTPRLGEMSEAQLSTLPFSVKTRWVNRKGEVVPPPKRKKPSHAS